MISIKAKQHDNFSVEFKFGFDCSMDDARDDFSVNAWMFVPNSLDINPEVYGKKQFYRDIKSNVRLIISKPYFCAIPIAIGTKIIVLIVLDWKTSPLNNIIPVNSR